MLVHEPSDDLGLPTSPYPTYQQFPRSVDVGAFVAEHHFLQVDLHFPLHKCSHHRREGMASHLVGIMVTFALCILFIN
jgi:hypothetical protein